MIRPIPDIVKAGVSLNLNLNEASMSSQSTRGSFGVSSGGVPLGVRECAGAVTGNEDLLGDPFVVQTFEESPSGSARADVAEASQNRSTPDPDADIGSLERSSTRGPTLAPSSTGSLSRLFSRPCRCQGRPRR